jgi:hypothetical protein
VPNPAFSLSGRQYISATPRGRGLYVAEEVQRRCNPGGD